MHTRYGGLCNAKPVLYWAHAQFLLGCIGLRLRWKAGRHLKEVEETQIPNVYLCRNNFGFLTLYRLPLHSYGSDDAHTRDSDRDIVGLCQRFVVSDQHTTKVIGVNGVLEARSSS